MAFAVTEGFYSRHFFKVQTNVETCHPRNPPGLASPNHPPLARGASSLHPKGSLVKGSWHGEAVTEGFYSRYFFEVQTYVKRGRFFRE